MLGCETLNEQVLGYVRSLGHPDGLALICEHLNRLTPTRYDKSIMPKHLDMRDTWMDWG